MGRRMDKKYSLWNEIKTVQRDNRGNNNNNSNNNINNNNGKICITCSTQYNFYHHLRTN